MKPKPKRKRRYVYISKAYFPKELWPKGITDVFRGWKYLSHTRQEAADQAWAEHKHELLPLMNDQARVICLHVDGDTPNNCAGRLRPIKVAHLEKPPKMVTDTDKNNVTLVDRVIICSNRLVQTAEFADEPGVFYYLANGRRRLVYFEDVNRIELGRSVSGPFPLDDPRFRLATDTDK